ncbi:hypothetical protein [Microbacterium sp. NPDC089188]|uniref:hypothetical protein n=1 Tax=Microbacterium sp. NPDC089188 TaxID=3154971 RepID=UPI00341B6B59
MIESNEKFWLFVLLLAAGMAFGISLRVGFNVRPDGIRFRSYFQNLFFQFGGADEFECVLYRGFWNRFSSGNGATNLGCYMLQVRKSSGRVIRLPATMGGRRTLRKAVAELNALTAAAPDSATDH